ncbi:MAG: DUF1667 domain-containing protein [Erysipelotrichaceae bacterium]|nr:DUF1667 domain-containing protein [Erysipelotrichaceae bacterium]
MENIEMICIGCPMGCNLTVTVAEDIKVSGNTCPNGEKYARNEVTNPVRVVTSSIEVIDGELNRVSCKSKEAINKHKIFEVMEVIKKTAVKAPVKIGDVLIENVAGTGVGIVSTKNVNKI